MQLPSEAIHTGAGEGSVLGVHRAADFHFFALLLQPLLQVLEREREQGPLVTEGEAGDKNEARARPGGKSRRQKALGDVPTSASPGLSWADAAE